VLRAKPGEVGGQPSSAVLSFQHVMSAEQAMGAPAVSAVAPPPDGEETLGSQIVQSISRLRRDGAEEMRVTLRPEYLGAVTISLRAVGDSVTAVIDIEEPQVRAWVQAHEALLREAMSGQGLTLHRLVVTDERPGREESGHRDQAHAQRRRQRQPHGADEPPTFEVAA
jgi:flagellar hook-length control protein FliK